MIRNTDKTRINTQYVSFRQNTKENKKTREGVKSGVGRLERMKHSSGIKDQEDKSNGIEILISEDFD